MQFTAAAFALFAAVAMIEPAQAGNAIGTIFKTVTGLKVREFDNSIYTRASATGIQKDFQDCMGVAKEHLKISKGPAAGSYYLKAADGSFPASCVTAASSYMKNGRGVDGTLKKNGDGSYTIKPLAKDVNTYEQLIKSGKA